MDYLPGWIASFSLRSFPRVWSTPSSVDPSEYSGPVLLQILAARVIGWPQHGVVEVTPAILAHPVR